MLLLDWSQYNLEQWRAQQAESLPISEALRLPWPIKSRKDRCKGVGLGGGGGIEKGKKKAATCLVQVVQHLYGASPYSQKRFEICPFQALLDPAGTSAGLLLVC